MTEPYVALFASKPGTGQLAELSNLGAWGYERQPFGPPALAIEGGYLTLRNGAPIVWHAEAPWPNVTHFGIVDRFGAIERIAPLDHWHEVKAGDNPGLAVGALAIVMRPD